MMTPMWSGGILIVDTLDMQTVFLLHEVEYGMNPEFSTALFARLLGDER